MSKRVEVTITVGTRKMTLEGPEDFVRMEVERFATLPDLEKNQSALMPPGRRRYLRAERCN